MYIYELASRADCGDREDEWVRDLFTAHMINEKIAEKLLAETRTPQEAYEYAIRREKALISLEPWNQIQSDPHRLRQ